VRLRRLSRSPVVFWAVVALLAVVTAAVIGQLVARARAEAARYGSLRTVAVATRALDVGAVVGPDDVAVQRVPAAFLPEGWLGASSDVVGHTVVVAVFRGQPVLRGQVAPSGLRGVAALLPPGSRAVAVPTGDTTPPVHTGDVVDVLATFDAQAAGDGDPTFPVAAGAVVVDVGGQSATVAVTPDEARKVAFAVSHGAVTLAVTAGR
jgi:Flp pilus assembly protein CpaB